MVFTRRRGTAVAGIAAIVLVVVAVVVVVLLRQGRVAGQAVPVTTAAAVHDAPLTAGQARALAADLTSGDERRVRAAVAVNPAQPLPAGTVTGLKSITSLAFDLTTFHDSGDGTARVRATVVLKGKAPAPWEVGLVADHGTWKISWTEQAR